MDNLEHLTITHINAYGRFLQICGHRDPQLMNQLIEQIAAYMPHKYHSLTENSGAQPNWELNTIYLFHFKPAKCYHRCILLEKPQNDRVKIELIDYGNELENVSIKDLHELNTTMRKGILLSEFPPITDKYILSSFVCEWKNDELASIRRLLPVVLTLPTFNQQKDCEHMYISLFYDGLDLTTKFVQSGIGSIISIVDQKFLVHEMCRAKNANPSAPLGATPREGNPVKKHGRHLVPNRPLQLSNNPNGNNNGAITNRGKRLIQNHLAPNTQRTNNRSETAVDSSQYAGAQVPVFIALDIPVNVYHRVYCTCVDDGPNSFWVQLKSQEHVLDRMINELNGCTLKNLTARLSVGMACIARSEDRTLYRAVIQKIEPAACRVTFVDFGNSERVELPNLFEIPERFLDQKTFSIRFKLAGCDRLKPMNDRLKKLFQLTVQSKDSAQNTELDLRVVQSQNPGIQCCDLYFKSKSVLEILQEKQGELNAYPNPKHLTESDYVIIRYAVSAKQFFVQRVKDISAFDEMMDRLFISCEQKQSLNRLPTKGECCAISVGDEWYRATVQQQVDENSVCVQLVDYGIEETCRLNQLRDISKEFIQFPRQVSECCLRDFANVPNVSQTTGMQLDMIASALDGERAHFRVSLHGRQSNAIYIVDLHDETKTPILNVSSSIFKNCMPRRGYGNRNDKNEQTALRGNRGSPASNAAGGPSTPLVREPDGSEVLESFTETSEITTTQKDCDAVGESTNGKTSGESSSHKRSKPTKGKTEKRSTNSADADQTKSSTGVDTNANFLENSVVSGVDGISQSELHFNGFDVTVKDALIPINSTASIDVVMWISPFEFYIQLKSHKDACDKMMEQIRQFYGSRQPTRLKPSAEAVAIVYDPKEKQYKRAKILKCTDSQGKYKVQFIDFGNRIVCKQSNIYEMELSFATLPTMAIRCSMENVVLNASRNEIHERIDFYFTKANPKLECQFISVSDDGAAIVEVTIDGANLKERMINDRWLNPLPKDISLKQLVAKQLKLKILSVTDLSSFQAQIHGCDTVFMCSYNDLSIAKNNQRISDQFKTLKQKYVDAKVESIGIDNILVVSMDPQLFEENSQENTATKTNVIGDIAPPAQETTRVNSVTTERNTPVSNIAHISHANHPNQFFLQLVSEANALNQLQGTLQIVAPSLPQLSEYRRDLLCVGFYSLNDQWYRAKIIDSDGEITSIQFIDYGITDSVTDSNLLKDSTTDISKFSPYALPCSLAVETHDGGEWSEKACEKLRTLSTTNVPVQFSFISRDEKINHVKLMVGDRDIAKELVSEKEAEPYEIIETGVNCFVSHVNSLNDFFIQVEPDAEALQLIESHVSSSMNHQTLNKPEIDTICAAEFTDGQYYRAKVLDNRPEKSGIKVAFLDYGNVFYANKLKAIEEKISQIPPLCKRCSLNLPIDVKYWSEAAEQKFRELSADGATEFTVKLTKPGKKACIELFIENENIANTLGSLCEKKAPNEMIMDDHEITIITKIPALQRSVNLSKITTEKQRCSISKVNSSADLYIQLESVENDLKVMSANLAGAAVFNPFDDAKVEVGTIGAAFFAGNQCYYRAKVLEKSNNTYKVLALDYGNETETSDFRELPAALKAIEPLAIHCKLDEQLVQKFHLEEEKILKEILLAENNATFQEVEIVDRLTRPITVGLFQNQKDIFACIEEQLKASG